MFLYEQVKIFLRNAKIPIKLWKETLFRGSLMLRTSY